MSMAARLAKIIEEGWGSSGYYSADVLKKYGPTAFPKGTLMYWNHATRSELKERPERDMNALAAVLVSDPVYDEKGKEGPGLYAWSQAFSDYEKMIKEKGPYTGLSIFAHGKRESGTVGSKKGLIVKTIEAGPSNSVDIVTKAGAGGKFLFESQNVPEGMDLLEVEIGFGHLSENNMSEKELAQLRESLSTLQGQNSQLATQNRRLEAEKLIRETLSDAKYKGIKKATMDLLVESLLGSLPVADDGSLNVEALKKNIEDKSAPLIESDSSGNDSKSKSKPRVSGQGGGTGGFDFLAEAAKAKKRLSEYVSG